jgi:hypothetical protein
MGGIAVTRAPLFLVTVALLVCLACTSTTPSGPSQPTPSSPPQLFQPGEYLLTIIGADFSTDPDYPPCEPVGMPPSGKNADTLLIVEERDGTYFARSLDPTLGSLQFDMSGVVPSSANPSPPPSWILGEARDSVEGPISQASESIVTFSANEDGEPPQVIGGAAGDFGLGEIRGGHIGFRNNDGLSSSCTVVSWSLRRKFW